MSIKQGDFVLLTLPSGTHRVIEIREAGTVNLGKFGQFEATDLLGQPYGQSFEIGASNELTAIAKLDEAMGLDDFGSSSDNRELRANSNVQRMTSEDIEQLKLKKGGQEVAREIIDTMIRSHESFDKKTSYSQEKYLTRKHKKFARRFKAEQLTPNALLEYLYHDKEPLKIMGLSVESLGMMMSLGNVMPGGDYLVVDETGGLVLFAMLERMDGKGSITLLHENDQPSLHLLSMTRWGSAQLLDSVVKPINVLQFLHPATARPEFRVLSAEERERLPEVKRAQYDRKHSRYIQMNQAMDHVLTNPFDSLIYASTLNPTTFVPRIIPRLQGSAPVVVYSLYKEVLVDLNHALLRDRRVLLPNIHHTAVRRYQTVPGKIHPLMTSRPPAGYILMGITVFPLENAQARGRFTNKKRKVDAGVEAAAGDGAAAEAEVEAGAQESPAVAKEATEDVEMTPVAEA